MLGSEPKSFMIDTQKLPTDFPTHKHAPEFWEALGRTVATFGFLEEVLGKAIFSFTGTRRVPSNKAQAEFEKSLPTLERALSDPLGGLIDSYAKAVQADTETTITNIHELVENLRKASVIRNVLCHGSWKIPDKGGKSLCCSSTKIRKYFRLP